MVMKNKFNALVGGERVLLVKKARDLISKVEFIGSCIIILAEVHSNTATIIITCYSLTNTSPIDQVDNLHRILTSISSNILAHRFHLIWCVVISAPS